jgi:transposase
MRYVVLTTGITIPAIDAERHAELLRRYNHAGHPESRLRYQMVLLSLQGFSVSRIADIVHRSHDTVTRVLHRYRDGGLDAVPRRKQPGRPRTVTPAWEAELLRVIELSPRRVGVESATWTTGLLAEYLARKTGIRVGAEAVRRYLHHHGYVCKRPTWSMKRKAQEKPDYLGNA